MVCFKAVIQYIETLFTWSIFKFAFKCYEASRLQNTFNGQFRIFKMFRIYLGKASARLL